MNYWVGNKNSLKSEKQFLGIDLEFKTAALLAKKKDKWNLDDSFLNDENNAQSFYSELTNWVDIKKKHSIDVSISLPFQSFNIYQVERPMVDDNELHKALKYKILDFIDDSLENISWDYIDLPKSREPKQQSCYLVTCRKKIIEEWIEKLETNNLRIKSICTPLSTLTLLMRSKNLDSYASALIWISEQANYIVILKNNFIYMIRELECDTTRKFEDWSEQLILEIQRSLDYCLTQYNKVNVVKCELIGTKNITESELSWMQKELDCVLNKYEFPDIISGFSFLQQQKLIYAIGSVIDFVSDAGE